MPGPNSTLGSLHAIVRGRVQGVYFRAFVQHHAATLGLTGYVRNLHHDMTVEVWAEGNQEKLEKLLSHLHQGPPPARVDKVDVEWAEYTGGFPSFEIRP